MIRGFFAMLPLAAVVALDAVCTLSGQPADRFAAYFLPMGPRSFALAMGGLAGVYILLVAFLPRFLGMTLYGAALLRHAWRASAWVPALARRRLSGLPVQDHQAVLAYFIVLSAFTVFCWRMGGVLPAAAPASKPGKDGKKDKGKDKD